MALGDEGAHARIVHAGHAHPGQGAARGLGGGGPVNRGDPERPRHEHAGDQQGEQGSARREARPQPGAEGQHGDEMGRPDRAAGHQAGQQQPGAAHPAGGALEPGEQAEGGEATAKTDQPGHQDQAEVMLGGQARENLEHGTPRLEIA